MQKLLDGIHKFQREIFGQHRELFQKLARGQKPEALFISCSDSRVDPTLLTQSLPGDVFVLRNAGNLVPRHGHFGGEAATIEYAASVLGVQDIIVCGHSDCGAMRALLHPPGPGELPAVRRWLEHAEATRRTVQHRYAGRSEEQLLNIAIQDNVLAQLENVRTHPSVACRLASGTLRLHGWVYKLETGEVFAFDPLQGQFVVLTPAVRAVPDPARAR